MDFDLVVSNARIVKPTGVTQGWIGVSGGVIAAMGTGQAPPAGEVIDAGGKPVEEGAAAGSVPEQDRMVQEYYELRGLAEDGRPLAARLQEADLPELAAKLYPG